MVFEVSERTSNLIREEIELAKTEVSEKVTTLARGSAVGIAAGYSLATGKTAMVSLHTYPGLASGMFNLRNAYLSGVPLFVVNGTELRPAKGGAASHRARAELVAELIKAVAIP